MFIGASDDDISFFSRVQKLSGAMEVLLPDINYILTDFWPFFDEYYHLISQFYSLYLGMVLFFVVPFKMYVVITPKQIILR